MLWAFRLTALFRASWFAMAGMPDSRALLLPVIDRPKAAALYHVGVARFELGDVRGAYDDLKEAARIEPQNAHIWQKYEEAYATVEREIAQEHAAQQSRERQVQSGHFEYLGAPPRFTFVALSEACMQPLQNVGQVADADAQDRALALQAGMLRGVLGGDRETHRSGDSHVRGRAISESEHWEHLDTRSRTEVEMHASNPRIFIGIGMCWITILCNVFIHYRYKTSSLPNTLAIFGQVVGIVVVCSFFACLSWRFLKTSGIRMSLSDGIKLLCFVLIQCCVCYFYISGGGGENHRDVQMG